VKAPGQEAPDHPEEETMTLSTIAVTVDPTRAATSPVAACTAGEPVDRRRFTARREAVLLAALVALVVAVAVFGLVFPELLAPAVAVAVLAAIVALDWLLPSGELRQMSARFRKH